MIKISAFPKCYIEALSVEPRSMSLIGWIEMAAQLQPDGLELYDHFFPSFAPSYLDEVRRAAQARGFDLPMMCYSPDFTYPSARKRAQEVAGQRKILDACERLGVTFCRTLSGQRRSGVARRDALRWVRECIEKACAYAAKKGITIVIENHYKDGYWRYPEFAQKMDVFLELVESVQAENFGVQYDPSNAIMAGDGPLVLLDAVIGRVRTIHASDRHLTKGTTLEDVARSEGTPGYSSLLVHGVVGEGLNDYDAIFRRLRNARWSGWVSIEDGMNGMEEMAKSIAFLRAKCTRYFP
ncbi:MAG: sugar phosphate isomerase/epimerase family protein [Planctomycetota bacterium]